MTADLFAITDGLAGKRPPMWCLCGKQTITSTDPAFICPACGSDQYDNWHEEIQ